MNNLLGGRSLRFWVAIGMIVAVAPLVISAGGGFLLLERGVIAPVHDVADRQRQQVAPTQHLRILIWNALIPVDEYVEEGDASHPEAYRNLRARIESEFSELVAALDPSAADQAMRARDSWTAADDHATALISAPIRAGDPRVIDLLHLFHGEIAATSDRLEAVYNQIAGEIQADHDTAVLFYERSLWLAGIAAAATLLALAFGVVLIGRVMAGSVDRLVEGAARFAEGDRDHRIQIQVPPELRRVADEFNHMIGRIHQSEEALSELAHLDSLTGLPNRRAFDVALSEAQARLHRFGEPAVLLALDIDHFKRINDTFGHAAGDAVLQTLARVMTENLRPYDKAFRLGGEEFTIVMPKADTEEAYSAAERLREALASTLVRFDGNEIGFTISIGVARTSDALPPDLAVKAADAALYEAKTAGRNRVVVSGAPSIVSQNANAA